MAYQYKSAQTFFYAVHALCKSDCYNLVLHKHLGDVFYAIAIKEKFENIYGSALHFIVHPRFEFLMHMYGIKEYSVYDLDELVINNEDFQNTYFKNPTTTHNDVDRLENEMFQAVFSCIPVKGEPFVSESLINNFFTYNRFWAYRWAANMGVEEKFRFAIPKHTPELSALAKKKLEKIGDLSRMVLIAPEAATAREFGPEFWDIIAERVHAHGYKIIVNSRKFKIKHGICAFDLDLPLSDIVALGLSCAYVFSLRSGLCDVLIGAGDRMYAFYPAILHRELYGLNKCFEPVPNVNEIALWHWKIDQVEWEGENLTKTLQGHINRLHIDCMKELVMVLLTLPSRRRRIEHIMLFCVLRDLAGKNRAFQENNVENAEHKVHFFEKMEYLLIKIYKGFFKN
ncbi:hypothetical protein FACS1894163_06960 [Spirochaetia bacterium]|nr:hypothetical protein FACS1894163_06960 [Spirochaetia bacterium]